MRDKGAPTKLHSPISSNMSVSIDLLDSMLSGGKPGAEELYKTIPLQNKVHELTHLLNQFCNAANINPPITPKDAASVGVVQPIYIEPITKMIKENIGIKNLELLILSINLI